MSASPTPQSRCPSKLLQEKKARSRLPHRTVYPPQLVASATIAEVALADSDEEIQVA